jgi:excisionase family DNA binding protein
MAVMPLTEDYWLTRPEVSERLRVPVKTLAQWASQGKGPRYRLFGRHARYALSDVTNWETAQFSRGGVQADPSGEA